VNAPNPIPYLVAEERVRTGHLDDLLEDVVSLVDPASADIDVIVVEGLISVADLQVTAKTKHRDGAKPLCSPDSGNLRVLS